MKQHTQGFLKLVEQAKKNISELSAPHLNELIDNHDEMYLVDVREESEWSNGHIPTAIHIGKGIIERDIEKTIPDMHAKIVVYCSGGFRSTLVAEVLQKMDYTQVYSLEKGLQGWLDNGFKLTQS